MPVLIALKLFAGNALGKLWGWLCHRSFWQIAFGVVAIIAIIQHFQLLGERRHSAKLEAQLAKIAEAGRAQKQVTERNVERVVKGDPQTKVIVRTIRDAPLPPDCGTPGLSTLRDVL